MMTINDWETQTQADMFDHYLETTADPVVRTLHGRGYSYEECEWHAYQHGWNAAKQYFTVEGQAL